MARTVVFVGQVIANGCGITVIKKLQLVCWPQASQAVQVTVVVPGANVLPDAGERYLSSVLFFFTAACYLLAYFCMRIARRLRRRASAIPTKFSLSPASRRPPICRS